MKLLVVLCALTCLATAHMLWSCPPPRLNSDDYLKSAPCGDTDGEGVKNYQTDGPYVTLAPGMLTVVMKETVVHTDAPARIALSINGDGQYNRLVLLDHIPHDNTQVSDGLYFVNVMIPDVNCQEPNKCSLQLMQVMNGGGTCSPNPATGYPQCSTYYSCANVRITGTQTIAAFNSSYTYVAPAGYANPTPNVWGPSSAQWVNNWQVNMTDTVMQPDICGMYVDGTATTSTTDAASSTTANQGVATTRPTASAASTIAASISVAVAACIAVALML